MLLKIIYGVYMQISFSKISTKPTTEALVFFIPGNLALTEHQQKMDSEFGGILHVAVKNKDNFKSKFGSSTSITVLDGGKIKQIVLFSLGDDKAISQSKFVQLGGMVVSKLASLKQKKASIVVDFETKGIAKDEIAAFMAEGAKLASYRFDKYFTTKEADEKFSLESLSIELADHAGASKLFDRASAVLEGVFLARDCVSEPANKLYPESYAKIIKEDLEECGIEVEIYGEHEMKNLGMGALLGVGQGSINESKMVVMTYKGSDDDSAPLAFVGKGVTFDSGGISIKPSAGMADMKYDMAGSATVVGLMKALAKRSANVNVVGVVGLVENMPGGNAQRPSDVVTTMSGQTVEILNTDAEGRLVLADVLWYTQDRFKPQIMVNLATLTGAIVVALGHSFAGCFSNNDDLSEKLKQAGDKVSEKIWRMPLCEDFDKMIKSDIADVANIGSVPGAAGSATAAHFLQKFVNNVPWAHLDIAGMAWEKKGSAVTPRGATGYGVRLLNQLIHDYYE